MLRFSLLVLILVSGGAWSLALAADVNPSGDWPQFRGYRAAGQIREAGIPADWDVESGKHVVWKTKVPGLGHASPIICGDAIYVVTAISGVADAGLRVGLYGDIASVEDDTVHVWKLYSFCKYTGHVLWERTLHRGVPRIKRHTKATHANATPATDRTH